jgi:hypothetical protein
LPVRRFVLLVLAGVAVSLTAAPGTASASAAASCVPATAASFRHSFHGPSGTATVTAVRPLCAGQSQSFSLVSYTAPAGLFIYDKAQAKITSARSSVSLEVAVPSCATQVYALTGTDVLTETTAGAPAYAGTTLGSVTGRSSGPTARYADDSARCAPEPQVTFTNACDGTFAATVTNAASANVPAVLVSGNRLTRVAPGRSTTLPAAAGTTLTFRASNLTTYVGTWRTPATPCTTSPSSAPTVASPQSALLPGSPAGSPAATATPSASPSSGVAAAPDLRYTGDQAALDAKDASATPTRNGMSAGSVLAIALGLLLMAGGVLILTKLIRANRQAA